MMEKEKKIELRSEEVQEVMNRVPPAILRYGSGVLLGIVLLLLAGSAWFSYPETVMTEFALSVGKDGLPQGTARVSMQDIGKIRTEQRAVIHLTGFPEQEYGFMEGTVTDVSPFPDEKGGYVLTVGLSSETVERCKAVLSQIKGTDGTAKIIIKERTLLECFFSFN